MVVNNSDECRKKAETKKKHKSFRIISSSIFTNFFNVPVMNIKCLIFWSKISQNSKMSQKLCIFFDGAFHYVPQDNKTPYFLIAQWKIHMARIISWQKALISGSPCGFREVIRFAKVIFFLASGLPGNVYQRRKMCLQA